MVPAQVGAGIEGGLTWVFFPFFSLLEELVQGYAIFWL